MNGAPIHKSRDQNKEGKGCGDRLKSSLGHVEFEVLKGLETDG